MDYEEKLIKENNQLKIRMNINSGQHKKKGGGQIPWIWI